MLIRDEGECSKMKKTYPISSVSANIHRIHGDLFTGIKASFGNRR